MTPEQAIRILHPDTPSDEVMIALDELGMDITNFMEADRNACILACEVLQREVESRADHSGEANKMVSNADKIRSMSDEELVGFLQTVKCRGAAAESCDAFWEDISYEIDWLRQPAKEETL